MPLDFEPSERGNFVIGPDEVADFVLDIEREDYLANGRQPRVAHFGTCKPKPTQLAPDDPLPF